MRRLASIVAVGVVACGMPSVHSGSVDGGAVPGSYVTDDAGVVLKGDGTGGSLSNGDAPGVAPSCSPATPAAITILVKVPEGPFTMGCNAATDDECREDEKPAHDVMLPAFEIDRTEVTQSQYFGCVDAGACTFPKCPWDPCARADHPVGCVNREQAIAYCTFAKKRLPTEAEWEKAARGTDGRKYPWGNDPVDCAHANMAACGGDTKPVGAQPSNASPYGALDMAGNVVEWTNDVYLETYYSISPATSPTGPADGPHFGGRGGGFKSDPIWQRAGSRDKYQPEYTRTSMGIRCAR
jgi:formylglycine-generating enzyme required for sulfatase activity